MNKKTIKIIVIEIIILVGIYYIVHSNLIEVVPKCWIFEKTSILCPSCGGTKCIIYFLEGNFLKSCMSNMVFFIILIYLMICNIVYLINLNRTSKILIQLYPTYKHVIFFTILLIIYTIVRNL